MKPRTIITSLAAFVLASSIQTEARADIAFDERITNDINNVGAVAGGGAVGGVTGPEMILGDGIGNDPSFVVDRNSAIGLELGIRAKQRYPVSANIYNSQGNSVYNFNQADPGNGRSVWNWDWSVNTDLDGTSGKVLSDYTYRMSIDFDPSEGVGNLYQYDMINGGNPGAGDAIVWDHQIGSGSTDPSGSKITGANVDPLGDYQGLIDSGSLAQNSWNMGFFDDETGHFYDADADGIYTVWLEAFDGGNLVAKTYMTVASSPTQAAIVPVPEPSSALLVSLILSIGCVARRKKRAVVEA